MSNLSSWTVYASDNHGRRVEFKARTATVWEALFEAYATALEEADERFHALTEVTHG